MSRIPIPSQFVEGTWRNSGTWFDYYRHHWRRHLGPTDWRFHYKLHTFSSTMLDLGLPGVGYFHAN